MSFFSWKKNVWVHHALLKDDDVKEKEKTISSRIWICLMVSISKVENRNAISVIEIKYKVFTSSKRLWSFSKDSLLKHSHCNYLKGL